MIDPPPAEEEVVPDGALDGNSGGNLVGNDNEDPTQADGDGTDNDVGADGNLQHDEVEDEYEEDDHDDYHNHVLDQGLVDNFLTYTNIDSS